MLWKSKKEAKNASFFYFWKRFPAYWIYKKKSKKEERKVMLKNTKSNSKKPASGYDRIEFYIDFVQVLLSAFMLGYVIGKQKREKEN